MLERSTTRIESAEQIDVDYGFKGIGGHSQRRCWKISGSTANDNVDDSKLFSYGADCRAKSIVVAHIGRKTGCGSTISLNCCRRAVEFLLSSSNQTNLRTVSRETLRD